MADRQTQLGVLRSSEVTPIAQLHPEIPDTNSRVVDGVITITWPYSIVTKSIAFILAEHDVRLRREKGQLRVEFHGAAGRALADSGVGGGDEVRLSLDGAEWEKNQAQMKLPGTPLGWQVTFTNRLLLSIRRAESQEPEIIDIDSPAEDARYSPEPARDMSMSPRVEPEQTNFATPLPRTPLSAFPSKRLASSTLEPGEYASPAFLKRARVSYGSLFEGGFDIFNEDEVHKSKKRRKSRFSMNATLWKYSSRSPSPEVEQPPDQDSEPNDDDEPVNTEEVEEAVEQSMVTPSRPTMVDQGCQTKELDFSPTRGVQVAAESRSVGMLLQSSPTPGWKHMDLSSEFQEPPTLTFDHEISNGRFSRHELGAIQLDETPVHANQELSFELPIDIDPRLQFQSVNAVDQHTDYSMMPTTIQPHQNEFHETQPHQSLHWATETSTIAYTTTSTHGFAEHPAPETDNPSPIRRPGTGSDEEEDVSHGNVDRVHYRAQEQDEIRSVSSSSSSSSESQVEEGEYGYDQDKAVEDRGISIDEDEDDDSTDDESEEDSHYDSQIPDYGSEEEYDGEYDYNPYAQHELAEDNEDDESEGEQEEGEREEGEREEGGLPPRPTLHFPWPIPHLPRPAPQPPKEPIFISLLSDSEDEDDNAQPGNIGQDGGQEVVGQEVVNRDEYEDNETSDDETSDNETSDESESEAEAENEVRDVATFKARVSSSSDRPRGLSQLDGCDDEVPIEPAGEDVLTNGAGAEIDRMDLDSVNEAHQIPVQANKETSAKLSESEYLTRNDEEVHARKELELELEPPVYEAPAETEEHAEALDSNGLNMLVHDASESGPSDAANIDKLFASPHDKEAATPHGERNANSPEAVDAVDPVTESSSLNTSNLPVEMTGVEISAKEHPENHSENPVESHNSHAEETAFEEAAETNVEKMDEDPTAHQDVEMQDTLPDRADEREIPAAGKGSQPDQDSGGILPKETEAPGVVAPTSPPDTQPGQVQLVPSAEPNMTDDENESAHQLPTPGDTQQDDMANPVQPELELSQEVEDDLAAEQQLMMELEQHSSSPQKAVVDVRRASAASSSFQHESTDSRQDQTPQREGRQKPEMTITVQSLRSHCRSHRMSIDSIDELSTDPSVLLARTSPTRLQHCLVGDITPPTTLRAMRARADQQLDASIALARASGSPRSVSPVKEDSPSTTIRVTRRKNGSPDRSVLLARSSPLRSPTRSQANSPKTASPPVTLRVARRRGSQLDPSLQLAALSPRSTRQQDISGVIRTASRGSHRSHTPETAVSGEALVSPALMSPALASPSISSSVPEEGNVSVLKLQLLRSLRTSLPDYLPLKSLRNWLTKTADILAVVTTTPAQPHRPKHGPRDYMLELTLTDPSVAPANVSVAHIFRPHQTSLPIVHAGDVVLLRRVQVVSMQGRGFGVRAGDASAWAVFEKGDEEMLPQIKGPPVEVVDEEVQYAQGLKRWWGLLDDKALARINKASHNKVLAAMKDDSRRAH